ncbi:MAG: amidohydrolase [Bdellovibrionales bacterium]|nr:amidohydrolase [Bdellovibrionales bacterium]
MMYDCLIECGKILIYKEGNFFCDSNKVIGVKEGKIAYLGESCSDLKSKKVYHLKNHLVSPGLINTHTHLPMSLFRGLADNLSLKLWLEKYIFPLEREFVDEDFIKVGTKLSVIEMIRSGMTTCCDMYFYNKTLAEVLDESGLRAYVGIGFPSVEKDSKEWKQKSLNLRSEFKKHPRIQIALAPHAPYTVESQTLSEMSEFAKSEDFFLTIHVSESLWEQKEIQKRYHKTPVQYLHDLGVTGKKSLFVHCVHVNQKDLQIMSKTGTSFSYNPKSNMKLGNGIAPVGLALQEGVKVGLGTDGSASNNNLNFFEEMGTGARLQALKYGDQGLTAEEMFKIASIGGARSLALDKEIGSLELGKKADIIALNLDSVDLHPFYNPISLLVYTVLGHGLDFVMCEGKVLMEDFKIKVFNELEVLEESKVFSKRIQRFISRKT